MKNYNNVLLILLLRIYSVYGENNENCSASISGAVIGTFFATIIFITLVYFLYTYLRKTKRQGKHLVLETDVENIGEDKYAFDNPCFKDAGTGLTSISNNKKCHPLFTSFVKNDGAADDDKKEYYHYDGKKRSVDDSGLNKRRKNNNNNNEEELVELRSHDFTGLGFTICGNMRHGIFIKDILHRGPAYESGQLNTGDRITAVHINFQHMVYEDAVNILSYASPYQVQIKVQKSRHATPTNDEYKEPKHPVYNRSLSTISAITKSNKYFNQLSTNSNNGDHDDDGHKSARAIGITKPERTKKTVSHHTGMNNDDEITRVQKFGIRVLPTLQLVPSPKVKQEEEEQQQQTAAEQSIDEVDSNNEDGAEFERQNSVTSSGIKRDEAGIPQEIPEHMLQAAVTARNNRKNIITTTIDLPEMIRKQKGKAPAPPTTPMKQTSIDDDEELEKTEEPSEDTTQSFELNSNEITVHHSEEEEEEESVKAERKTASTGDLSRIVQKSNTTKNNVTTLERAQSLDITETNNTTTNTKKRKATKDYLNSMLAGHDDDEDSLRLKEPRLSLNQIVPVNRLKKSSEWGNLEDVICLVDSSQQCPNKKNIIWPETEIEQQIEKQSNSDEKVEVEEKIQEERKPETTIVHNIIWPNVVDQIEEKTQIQELDDKQEASTTFKEENPGKSSQNFLLAERYATTSNQSNMKLIYDTNVSDDIKVSRHSLGSLERPKSDVLKSVNRLKMQQQLNKDNNSFVTEIEITNNDAQMSTSPSSIVKSRIPVATTTKSIIEQQQPVNRNISITSIRNNSRNGSKPPLPIRPDNITSSSAAAKQWIPNPSNDSVTNIIVNNSSSKQSNNNNNNT